MTTFGRYEVQDKLGQGSFAAVYRAWDPLLRRAVAIKMLLPGWVEDREIRARFTTESQMLAGLRHPNIVTVHDVGEAEGRPFFAMELVDGPTLEALLAEKGPMPAHQVSAILNELASAVDYLHGERLLHRDIKPANVMLDPGGRAVLMDFNIARSLEATRLTSTGVYLGTPGASAPEQILGRPLGPATDIYALGVLTYQLLAGRPPFSGDLARVGYAIINEAPPPIATIRPDLPPASVAAIDAALAKQPEVRPAPARAFAEAFAGRAPTRPAPVMPPDAPRNAPLPSVKAYAWQRQPPPPASSQMPPPPGVAGPFPATRAAAAIAAPGVGGMAGPWAPLPKPAVAGKSPRALCLGWLLASLVATLVAVVVVRVLADRIDQSGRLDLLEPEQRFLWRLILAGVVAAVTGAGQAAVLPLRPGSRVIWWLITITGYGLAYAAIMQWLEDIARLVLDGNSDLAGDRARLQVFLVVGALIGAGASLLQSLKLIEAFDGWWLWPPVSALGMALGTGVAYTAFDFSGSPIEFDAARVLATWLIFAAVSGVGLLVMAPHGGRS